MGKFFFDMRLTLSTNYVIPAVLLNPILFLHSLNALLSRLLPPITIDAPLQPPSYYPLGPSAQHPHIDMHVNDNLCWSYTLVMVFAQLVAFGRISRAREEMRERDAQSEPLEVPGGTKPGSPKVAVGRPGMIRRISKKEIPLEREAYSTDEDTDSLEQIEPSLTGEKTVYGNNGVPKGRNGHALTPLHRPQTSMVR